MSAGKGDTYRPVDWDRWREGYERIFGVREKGNGCHESAPDNESCNRRATPDPDINPAEWEDKDE